ncbi:MAG: FtsX-like permease family protein [Ilumatobacteraceae bacterium]
MFRTRVQDAVGPLVVTLIVLGAVILVATLFVAGHALARQIDTRRSEREAVRAVGFTRSQERSVELLTVVSVGLPSALLAVAVVIGLSPWFPTGTVRRLEPARGIDLDAMVLTIGAVVILLVLVAVARPAGRRSTVGGHSAGVPLDGLLGSAPVAVGAGLRLAIGGTTPERRRFWTTIATSAVALALVLGGIGFVASLARLTDEPARYGVAWDLTARNAYGDVDPEAVRTLVAANPDIRGVAGAGLSKMIIGDQSVAAMAMLPITADLWPTVLVVGRRATTTRSWSARRSWPALAPPSATPLRSVPSPCPAPPRARRSR